MRAGPGSLRRSLVPLGGLAVLFACQAPPHPWTRALRDRIGQSDRLVVRGYPWMGEAAWARLTAEEQRARIEAPDPGPRVLLEVADPAEVRSLIDALHVDDSLRGMVCACAGNPQLEFYRGEERTGLLTIHHGISVRWRGGDWDGDGLLIDGSAAFLRDWLADRGVPGPKQEFQERLERRRRARREDAR